MSHDDDDAGFVFRASQLRDLAHLERFLDGACSGVEADARGDLRLACEEVFVNIFRHGYRDQAGPVEIRLSHTPGRITVLMTDQAPAFDPASLVQGDLAADWREREIGGLGWHLVHRVVDEVGWAPGAGHGNVYRLVKHVPKGAAGFQTTTKGQRT